MNKKLRRLCSQIWRCSSSSWRWFWRRRCRSCRNIFWAVADCCATLLLLGCYQWLSVRRRRRACGLCAATSEMLQHTSDGEMPFPVALVKLNDNELVWYNRAFAELTHVRERMSAQSLSEVIPGLSAIFWPQESRRPRQSSALRGGATVSAARSCRMRTQSPASCSACSICSI